MAVGRGWVVGGGNSWLRALGCLNRVFEAPVPAPSFLMLPCPWAPSLYIPPILSCPPAGEKDVTTGASSDLEQATRLARAMVTRYGMSERVGHQSIHYEDEGRSLSSETRAVVEEEVKGLLTAAYARAKQVLRQHEKELHALAAELIDKETLTVAQITELLLKVNGKVSGKAAAAAAPAS